jgi:hypothetical protein
VKSQTFKKPLKFNFIKLSKAFFLMPKVKAGKEIQAERARPRAQQNPSDPVRPFHPGSKKSSQLLPLFQSSRFKVRCSDAESARSKLVKASPTQSNQIKPPLPLPVKKSVKKRSSFWLFLTT